MIGPAAVCCSLDVPSTISTRLIVVPTITDSKGCFKAFDDVLRVQRAKYHGRSTNETEEPQGRGITTVRRSRQEQC